MGAIRESGFSRTLDDPGAPTGRAVSVFQGILGRSEPKNGRLYRKCGRTKIRISFDHLARATMAAVDSDVSFESRFQRPSCSSRCSRNDHRLATTRQIRALIASQKEAVPFSFSRSVRTGALADTRQFRMPAGHNVCDRQTTSPRQRLDPMVRSRPERRDRRRLGRSHFR
jgi:hypothetical protein